MTEPTKFNQEQYDLLLKCSVAENLNEWNDWRTKNRHGLVYLEGADLNQKYLCGADFSHCFLSGAGFIESKIDGASFLYAHLDRAILNSAICQTDASLKARVTDFSYAELRGAHLVEAKLVNARFREAELRGANLTGANLEGADFSGSYLEGARLLKVNIRKASFALAAVSGPTLFEKCEFDSETDFTGVGLDSTRIEPELKSALKNNIRRIHWRKWVEDAPTRPRRWFRRAINLFWRLSDYGSSTGRIVKWFFYLAVGFGLLYWIFAILPGDHSIVANLRRVDGVTFSWLHTLARSLYFSIVTMTTLGFGDMHAAKTGGWQGYLGYFFLSVQVIIGYVLLGALVTRLGILFTSEAPAAAPTPIKKGKEKKDSASNAEGLRSTSEHGTGNSGD